MHVAARANRASQLDKAAAARGKAVAASALFGSMRPKKKAKRQAAEPQAGLAMQAAQGVQGACADSCRCHLQCR